MKGERKSIRCKEFKNFEFLENSSDLVSNRSNTFEPWETNEKKIKIKIKKVKNFVREKNKLLRPA